MFGKEYYFLYIQIERLGSWVYNMGKNTEHEKVPKSVSFGGHSEVEKIFWAKIIIIHKFILHVNMFL